MQDRHYMQLAIELAQRGLYTTAPNPRVGCVLVRDDKIIGQGYHLRAGEGHAEVNAIAGAVNAEGATAYVTLEPCSHTGQTPPCADALIAAGVARVVIAMADPNPLVSGRGVKQLKSVGINVEVGLMAAEAHALNPGFIKRMETGLPWVRVKLAMSLDGRTAMASGESQWITGAEARSDVQRLRARSCAILLGVDTVIHDDAALTVRADELGLDAEESALAAQKQPLRVVFDSNLRLSPSAKILAQPGETWVVTAQQSTQQCAQQRQGLIEAGAQIVTAPNQEGRIDLQQVLQLLAEKNCNEVLVEAGATLAGAFAQAGLVDQYSVYMAPTFMGSAARPLLHWPLQSMAEQQLLDIDSVSQVGVDWRIDARPRRIN
jgi:diaminohydroxyphosphoribosylaminopyrimidine deaminase/5-amino-6-(5-phosphoribosylamino)uracil reductase